MLVKYCLRPFMKSGVQQMLAMDEQVFIILRLVRLKESCQSRWVEFKAGFGA